MESTSTPNIPPLPGEDSRPYLAFVIYATLGSERSLAGVCTLLDKKPGYIRQLARWSTQFHWTERAHAYDVRLAAHATEAHTTEYKLELEEHRAKYQKLGKTLCKVAEGYLAMIAKALRGETIEGKDGKIYFIPTMPLNQNALGIVARTLLIAADLEAHALGLDKLLVLLDGEDESM